MITILDWIFEGAAKWIASIVTQLLDGVSGIFLNALGTDMTAMEEYFPFVTSAFNILQYTAWMILLLVTVWQLFRTFGGPITEAENPWHLLARSSIFAFLIGFSKDIFMICLDIARGPYTALWDYSMGPADFTFAGIENVLTSGVITIVGTISVVGTILIVIMMICIGWNYFKLLLESVERYVLVGVLCYTSPLAFAMGGSKATNKVFASWCRMVGSQLLLLIMNIWFLRAFSSSVGQFTANAGALSTGQGNIFLWLFCALAMLKVAQKFDNYLSALGLSVAQTGGGMGLEMMMAARVLGGFGGGGSRSIGSVFRGGASAGGSAAGAAGMAGGFAGFASKFKGNSYVRDAVVQGGSKMGMGGGVGFVGRAFGGIAARGGTQLSGDSISSVASRAPSVSGSIGGDIANRSLGNYMPQLSGKNLSNTEITGGQIWTTATGTDGKEASLQLFNASQFEQPTSPHSIVNASDGSYWYQTATGAGAGEFYSVPEFTGDASEAAMAAATFPGLAEGASLRTVDDGVLEATDADGNSSLMYNSAFYQEPDAPHDTLTTADGVSWYSMQPHADMPQFDTGSGISDAAGGVHMDGGSEAISTAPGGEGAIYNQGEQSGIPSDGSIVMPVAGSEVGAPSSDDTPFYGQVGQYEGGAIPDGSVVPPGGVVDSGSAGADQTPFYSQSDQFRQPDGIAPEGVAPQAAGTTGVSGYTEPISAVSGGEHRDGVPQTPSADSSFYNQAQFQQFMPGYSEKVSSVDASRRDDGMFEVKHKDGSGTQFYDKTMYQSPRGDYKVFEDNKGGQWYAIHGNPSVERKPVYENGKAVHENGALKTVNVETVKYKTTPTKFGKPKKRDPQERNVPKRR